MMGFPYCWHFPIPYFEHFEKTGNLLWDQKFDVISNANEVEYKLCNATFPGSKFILPIRNIDEWLISIEKFILRATTINNSYAPWIRKRLNKCLGSPVFNKELYRENYLSHKNEVKRYFSDKSNLLLFPLGLDSAHKWKLLSDFLGPKPPPCEYPHRNRGK